LEEFSAGGLRLSSWNNIELYPDTWRICNIPGLITVMFSIMEPGKHLPPYYGIDSVPVIWVAIPRNRH
jgi:beta-hydroxylase